MTSTTGMTARAWSTKGSPESHSSTPSHQLRNPFTGPTLLGRTPETNVAGSAGALPGPSAGPGPRNTSVAVVDAERLDSR
jgi:hypothetical protein